MSQSEYSKRFYWKRKSEGLCPTCGKAKDRNGHYCSTCLIKQRIRQRENRAFYRENHLCTSCGKNAVFGNDKTCFECRAKKEQRRKEPTKEQKERYRSNFRERQNRLYRERVEKGICTRCGKTKAIPGKKKCGMCLGRDAELHRRKYFDKPSTIEYRKDNKIVFKDF